MLSPTRTLGTLVRLKQALSLPNKTTPQPPVCKHNEEETRKCDFSLQTLQDGCLPGVTLTIDCCVCISGRPMSCGGGGLMPFCPLKVGREDEGGFSTLV